ncbi:hypothetical protein GGTG_07685 [Gaeumannomyces tritici R3-111a-1]|uniref:Uncharacterized protein n=1 Tax=Gaeumannomyces tritici (strain R3-111a-1) TaxID=644352 RepID=J3P2D8_GAET3|nr:hypothetical protein GGTG_07685 [Gaeumannomyces tritici R3-111a-1]EJT73830.1 hypothetical protein GGTG_07685 [Gaeumannomyces tritici R3-111a-1]
MGKGTQACWNASKPTRPVPSPVRSEERFLSPAGMSRPVRPPPPPPPAAAIPDTADIRTAHKPWWQIMWASTDASALSPTRPPQLCGASPGMRS